MTISFSGLASGLDTSSWVESLVALKQAKVETLEEEKETVLLSQETLNNIKSFFSSFRSLIEKVTDAKFGVASMDLFTQNLATSSNLDVLTASATTEAEEATYNVLVDKLASETQAVSNYSYLTTIVQTTTATNDSKLTSLGVKAGNIGVTVNGVERGLTITENDTIATLIEKLQNIGVEASYNEETGVFSMNIDDGAINDIDGTGIVDALHLEGVNEGYTSDHLQTSQTDTVYSAATEATLLTELGVKAGVITIHANDRDYNVTITNSSTLGSFIADLENNNIEAELDATGVFTISDAEITNEGTTDILDALGLAVDIYGKTQSTGDLTHETVVTQTTTATSSTLLKDLGEGTAISNGQTVIVRDSNNEYTTITVGTTTTLGELLQEMSNAGLYAALNSDGTVEIAGGTITGGTFDAVEALGLEREPYTAMVTGDPLTETVEVHKLVDLQTRLVDDLKVTEGYLEVTDADGNLYYEKIYSGQTIADFMTDMGNLGIATSLDEETGILTITGGAFKTLTDADVQDLVNKGTIREPDSRYIKGTNLLECLYGSGTISTDHITVASTYSKTQALSHQVTNTISASLTTTLGNLHLTNGTAVFDVRGEKRTINVSQTMTIEGLMNALNNVGIESSWDNEHSKIMIENATLTGGSSNLADVLNLTTTVSGKYVTSDALYSRETITIDATRDTVLADYGITNSMSTADRTVNLYNSDGTLADTMVVGEGTTIGNLLDWINGQGDISATLEDGYLTINNGYIENAALEASMGLETSNKSSYVLGSVMTVTTTAAVTGETTLGEIISTLGTTSAVQGGYNLSFNSHNLAVSANTTINELINLIYDNGGTAVLDNTGRLSINGGTLTGSVATALGITSITHTSSVSATGESLFTTKEEYADLDTTFADIGINNSSFIIHDNLGTAIRTISVTGTDTIGSFFDDLKANGIDGTISNGVITLNSEQGRYITGALANSLGLDTQTVTEVVNTTQSSTIGIVHTDTVLADLTSTLGAIGAITGSGQNILIYDENRTCIGTISNLTTSSTVEDMFNALKAWGIQGSIANGVMSFYSESGRYAAGTIMTNLGVTIQSGHNVTFTIAQTITSSGNLTYNETVTATEDSLISDFVSISGTSNVIVYDKENKAIGTVGVTSTSTFGDLFRGLAQYGIDGDIHDGVIKLSPDNGEYATGSVLTSLGINTTQIVGTKTVGVAFSSTTPVTYTVAEEATLDTTFAQLVGEYDYGKRIVVIDDKGVEQAQLDITSDMTIGDFFALLEPYGFETSIIDGVIRINSKDGWAIGEDGNTLLTDLGIELVYDRQTITTGMTSTSTIAVTYTSTVMATASTTMEELGVVTSGYLDTINPPAGHLTQAEAEAQGFTCVSDAASLQAALQAGEDVMLMSDIDLSGIDWTPINYNGTFDGNGYTISNVSISSFTKSLISGVNCMAFFAATNGATLKNLRFENVSMNVSGLEVSSMSGQFRYGLLAGQLQSTNVENVSVEGEIYFDNVPLIGSNTYLGGLAGYVSNSTISSSYSNIDITGSCLQRLQAGGFVGNVYSSTITNCAASGGTSNVQRLINPTCLSGFAHSVSSGTITNNKTEFQMKDFYISGANSGGRQFHFAYNISSGVSSSGNVYDSRINPSAEQDSVSGVSSSNIAGDLSEFAILSKEGKIIGRFDITENTTIGDIMTMLGSYGIEAKLADGVLSITSLNGNYVNGTVPKALGIEVEYGGSVYKTVGATTTSTAAVTYTTASVATETTTFNEILNPVINGTITATGVTGDVIAINNATDLQNLANLVNAGNDMAGKIFIVTNSLNLSSISNWVSIGNADNPFAGTFDGSGLTISYMKQTLADDDQGGLFGYTDGATIKNINLSNFTVSETASTTSGYVYTGALVGYAKDSTISGVSSTNTSVTLGRSGYSGGLIGRLENSTIEWCSISGTIKTSAAQPRAVGGLIGQIYQGGTITACYNQATVIVDAETTGGLVGQMGLYTVAAGKTVTITDSYNSGTVANARTSATAGGILASVHYNNTNNCTLNILNCYNSGRVYTASSPNAHSGSIIGIFYNVNSITKSNTVNISNTFATTSGDAVGYTSDYNTLNDDTFQGGLSDSQLNSAASAVWSDTTWSGLNGSGLPTLRRNNDYTIDIKNPDGTRRTTLNLNGENTLSYLNTILHGYGISVSLEDGVLHFTSNNGNYVAGSLADALGITTSSTTTTTQTIGTVSTSTSQVVYTQTVTADASTTLLSLAGYKVDGTITASSVTGTVIAINSAADLYNLARLVSNGNSMSGKTFILTDDIDLSSYANWIGIGTTSHTFNGNFDGMGHTISNLKQRIVSSTNELAGLFKAANGTIKNIKLDNVSIYAETTSSGSSISAGALIGSGWDATISGIEVTNLDMTAAGYNVGIGGIFGFGMADISNCYVSGEMEGNSLIGGIAARYAYGTGSNSINACQSDVHITQTDSSGMTGGMVGQLVLVQTHNITITNCVNNGRIDAPNSDNTGGLVGLILLDALDGTAGRTLNITNCLNKGNVVQGYDLVGDIYTNSTTGAVPLHTINYRYCYAFTGTNSKGLYGTSHGVGTVNATGLSTISPEFFAGNALARGFDPDVWDYIDGNIKTTNEYEINIDSALTGSNALQSKISFDSQNTLGDIINALSPHGQAYIRNGQVIFESDDLKLSGQGTDLLTAQKAVETNTLTYDSTIGGITGSLITRYYITVVTDGTSHTITVRATDTIADMLTMLASHDIEGSINDGLLTLKGDQNVYIRGMSSTLKNALHIDSTYATSIIYERISDVIFTSSIASMTTSTTLGELGLASGSTANYTVGSNGKNYTVTVKSTDTVGDIMTTLAGFGIAGVIEDGKLKLIGSEDSYVVSFSSILGDLFQIQTGSGYTYNSHTYQAGTNTNSNKLSYQSVNTLTTSTTFGELGLGDVPPVTVVSNGVQYSITVKDSDTVDDFISTLAGFGISASVHDGKITIVGTEDAYVSAGGSVFDVLNLADGSGNNFTTKVETTFSNTASDHLTYDETKTLSYDTTFAELGMYNSDQLLVHNPDYSFGGNNGLVPVAITPNMTINDMLTALAGVGIQGEIVGGRIYFSASNNAYITMLPNHLVANALHLTTDTYTTVTSTTNANTTSNEQQHNTVRTMTTDTTFGEMGLTSTAYITVVSNGTQHVVTVTSSQTVDDIISTLAGYGISGAVANNGRLTFTGGVDTYIKDMSQTLKNILKLTAGQNNSWTTGTEQTWVNSDSDEQTEVKDDVLITGDTILSSIQGYNNGNGRLVVHQTNGKFTTITVSASSTIDDFFDQIADYGLVGTIGEDGKVTITGVGNVYLQAASGGTNILTALKMSNVISNVQTITSNRTSDTLTHTVTVAASGTTTLENLEDTAGNGITFNGSGNVSLVLETTSDAGNQKVTLNFSRTQSLYDVIDALAQYGIQASIDAAGRFSVSSSNLTDFDISGELGDFLMGNYTKEYGEDTTYNVSTNLVETTVVYMNDASKLADFGITGGNILITQQGVNYTINIDPTSIITIGDFRNLLAEYGFNSIIDSSGRLSVTGIGESYLSSIAGGSNIIDRLGLTDWTLGEITQSSDHLTDTEVVVNTISMSDRIADLTDAAGNNLGITDGQIYVYQDGTRSTVNIDTNDTLETLAAKLSQYGITVGISQEGRLYFDGNNDSYLTTSGLSSANASNILSKLNIEGNWSTRYDSTSGKLQYTEEVINVVDRSTKLSDLKDASGNDLNITEGTYYVYSNGVRNTETITADTTVNDFMATLAKYGLIADIAEDGSISVGAYNNTYLATSALAGQNSNVVSTLFAEWDFVNIYTSNGLDIPTDEIRAINRDTKLADINEGTYQAGYITVVKDGVQTNIELKADDTVGTLMDELALYGFESVINEDGQLIIKNSGDSLLQNYTGSGQASNALTLLGIGVNDWISTNTYKSDTLNVVQTSTLDASATRDTLLSELGVSTGEYYVYNNGVKYTALISSDETLGSFMDTLKSFGLETSLVQGPDGAVLSIVGKGNSYIAKSASTTNASNVVDVLFTNGVEETNEYSGLQQTSTLVTTFSDATLDTKLSYYDTPWGTGMLTAEGDLSVTVNGVESVIKITADETFGSLIEKFNALGLEATLANGELMIQSGYDTFTINTAGTTSSILSTIGLTYHNDLGGYVASDDTVLSTTTSIEEKTLSVSNYADMNTKLGTLNISDGSLTVYRNGERATIQIDSDDTFSTLRSRLAAAFSDLELSFEDGYLKIYSTDPDADVQVGSTTDKGNFAAITGITNDGSGSVKSARELYCVNVDSVITTSGIFRNGDVTEGTFIVGNATFTIDDKTTLSGLIAQINASDEANATAFWDNIDGKLVIKSRTTGSAFVNIEAGTSNFTDIMGYTTSEWAADGSLDVTRMNIDTQEVGENARVQINGTTYTSTSNTITSDVSRIKGLTINLKGLTEGTAVTLTVERDKETLANAISDVVDSYNELMKNVDEAIATEGALHGETTLKLIRNQLRNMMTSSDSGTTIFRNLDSIGISVSDASASNISTTNEAIINLAFDKDKFLDAFEADQDAVKELLIGGANNTGIFTKVETLLESALQSVTGYFSSADDAYQREINRLDDKIAKANEDVERYRARLEAKFSAMDMLIAQMQQQYSTFLTT